MSRIDRGVIVQLEELLHDRMDERVEVSSWKIGPSDGLVEESITSQYVTFAREADTSWRMSWSMEDTNLLVPYTLNITIFEVAVNLGWGWNFESHELAYARLHRL